MGDKHAPMERGAPDAVEENARDTSEELRAAIKELRAAIKELRAEAGELRRHIQAMALRAKLADMRAEVAELRDEIMQLTATIDMMRVEAAEAAEEHRAAVADLDAIAGQLESELGILNEMRAEGILAKFQNILLQQRTALYDAPASGRHLYHLDELSRYWDHYEAWYTEVRGNALMASRNPLASEIDLAQRLDQYEMSMYAEDYLNGRSPERLSRLPYDPSDPHLEVVAREGGQCPGCGVAKGQLHLVSYYRRPICHLERCPQCKGHATRCRHCIRAVNSYQETDYTRTLLDAENVPF